MNTQDVVQHVTQTVAQNKAATIIDVSSLTIVGATLMEIIPPITAVLSLIWVGMRLYLSYIEIKKVKKDESS